MAVEITGMDILIHRERNQDGTYTDTLRTVAGSCADPTATSPTARSGGGVQGIVKPAFKTADTVATLISDCFAAVKTAAGAP